MRVARLVFTVAIFGAMFAATGAARADERAIDSGRALLNENRCNGSCHQSHSDDNEAISMYTRENRKVRTFPQLEKQVNYCVLSLGSQIFAEDIGSVVSALNADYYKLK